jgi:hypothetical protein
MAVVAAGTVQPHPLQPLPERDRPEERDRRVVSPRCGRRYTGWLVSPDETPRQRRRCTNSQRGSSSMVQAGPTRCVPHPPVPCSAHRRRPPSARLPFGATHQPARRGRPRHGRSTWGCAQCGGQHRRHRQRQRGRRRIGERRSACATAAATFGGTDLRSDVTSAGVSLMIFMMICCADAPVCGGLPVSISKSIARQRVDVGAAGDLLRRRPKRSAPCRRRRARARCGSGRRRRP